MTPTPPRAALKWAPFLACSWTWCIGMFLPILMVRDFGWLGFVVFAVPNVVGAAAVGWFVTSPEASRRWVDAHRPAMRLFSWITIAFHAYWIGWLARWLPFENAPTVIAWNAGAMGLVSLLALKLPGRVLAWPLWLLSCGVFVCFALAGEVRTPPAEPPLAPGRSHDLLWLAPLVAFGFLLCPMLDLTLHRARRGAGDAGRLTFALGFGVCFLAMISLTYAYAGRLLATDDAVGLPELAIVAHLLGQLCFTVGEHTRDLAGHRRSPSVGAGVGLIMAIGIAIGLFAGGIGPIEMTATESSPALTLGEIGYRTILAAYGTLFPAYVWICLIPRDAGPVRKPSRRTIAVWLIAVAVAIPFLTVGYLMQRHVWLAPGLFVLLAARLFVPRSAETPSH